MKLVRKYTLVLGLALVVIVGAVNWMRGSYNYRELVAGMRRDHQVVGGVLRAGIEELWTDTPESASSETRRLLATASSVDPAVAFEWSDDRTLTRLTQTTEHDWFVSRFPIHVRAETVGVLVLRESMHDIESIARANLRLSMLQIALIVLCGAVASFVLGHWLVGRRVALLVDHMRRIGKRDLASRVTLNGSDELVELANEMNAASRALDEATDQVRHADRLATVGKLAAGIAHELGTPLSVVSGHAQMIAEGEAKGETIVTSARAIDAEAARMSKIVRQLLDFARRKGPEGTTCDPTEVARRCTGLLGLMADKARVNIEMVAPEPCRASIDEDSLQQVLTNLVVNAIHAMPDGGELRVAVTHSSSRQVRIDVSDTGKGMTDEIKARIFEPFFTTKPTGDGTGLGLAVVYGIVVDHGGRVDVTTSERGTTFSVVLQEAS